MRIRLVFLLASICSLSTLQAQADAGAAAETVAFVGLENASGDPGAAYLAPIIEGLLLFDLTQGRLDLADRKQLQKLLAEQEFQQAFGADTAADASTRAGSRLGKTVNARWLLYGNYALSNGEIFLNLQLADVQSAETWHYRERGRGEHTVHVAAEKLIRRISGRTVVLADASNDRSLVSLRDETPGTLNLHSAVQGAKIYIDNEFVGFTKGDERTPLVFDRLAPGRHRIKTDLGHGFGVLRGQPVQFVPWDVEFEIRPGRTTALIDETRIFYEAFRRLSEPAGDSRSVPARRPELLVMDRTFSFVDSQGQTVTGRVQAGPPKGDQMNGTFTYTIGKAPTVTVGLPMILQKEGVRRESTVFKAPGMELVVEAYTSMGSLYYRWEINRTDLDEEALQPG